MVLSPSIFAVLAAAVICEGAGRAAEEAAEQGEERTRPNQTEGPRPAPRQDPAAVCATQGGAGAVPYAVCLQTGRRRGNQTQALGL